LLKNTVISFKIFAFRVTIIIIIIIIIVVSSAKKEIVLGLLLMTVGKSLMYKRESRGSSIEP